MFLKQTCFLVYLVD